MIAKVAVVFVNLALSLMPQCVQKAERHFCIQGQQIDDDDSPNAHRSKWNDVELILFGDKFTFCRELL